MEPLRFFDSRAMVGRHLHVKAPPFNPHTREDLYEEMDQSGVGEAMVLDCLSREHSPADGNPRILEVTKNQPRLYPAWVAVPAGTDETPEPREMIAQMRQHGVGLLYLLPAMYRFPLSDWCVDDLLEPMAETKVPLFIAYDGGDSINWPQVVDLCRRFPTLPVIISETRIRRDMRVCYKALEACDNLHLELSSYWLHRGIEYLSSRFGSHRLLFGSNWPKLNMACTRMPIASAEIEHKDKQLIAGDNLRKLIAWAVPEREVPLPPEPKDELEAWARTGVKPEGIKVYDNHGHLGKVCLHYHVVDGATEKMVRDMDRYGIEQICVFSLQGVFSDERYGNDLIIEAVEKFPERFVGFTLVNPHRGHDWMMEELNRCKQAGLRGVKLHATYQGYPETGPNIDTPCQFAHDHGQMILNHEWGNPEQMDRLVRTYTDACFFTGHTTSKYQQTMSRYENLYVCSCPVHEPFHVERTVAAVGADRFLFGSDLTDLPIAWGIGPILLARISEADRRKIISDNLKNLLTRYSLPTGKKQVVATSV